MERRKWIKQSLLAGGSIFGATVLGGGLANAAAACVGLTPKQPLGPFFPERTLEDEDSDLTKVKGRIGSAIGEVVYISGKIIDQHCEPVQGALIELWQADSEGRYDHSRDPSQGDRDLNFQYWSRLRTDQNGRYQIKTIIPGAYLAANDWIRPPHIHFQVTKRGYLDLVTQMYFEGDPLNEHDLILKDLPIEEQKKLIVKFDSSLNVSKGVFDISIKKLG